MDKWREWGISKRIQMTTGERENCDKGKELCQRCGIM